MYFYYSVAYVIFMVMDTKLIEIGQVVGQKRPKGSLNRAIRNKNRNLVASLQKQSRHNTSAVLYTSRAQV